MYGPRFMINFLCGSVVKRLDSTALGLDVYTLNLGVFLCILGLFKDGRIHFWVFNPKSTEIRHCVLDLFRGIHSPMSMMHIAYYPYLKKYKFHLFLQNVQN